MKTVKNILLLSLIIGFISCEKDLDSEGVSKITYFPEFEYQGDEEIFVAQGSSYTDPGVKAFENGKEITVSTTVKGIFRGYSGTTVNVNTADKYIVTYKAVNSDGFDATVERTVWVYKNDDFTSGLEGIYTARVKRTPSQGAVPATKDLNYIYIWKNTNGTYQLSDGIGGYYDIGRAYGEAYRAAGATFSYDFATSTFTAGPSFGVGAFGGVATITSFSIDPATRKITFTTDWDAGYQFTVTLTQVAL